MGQRDSRPGVDIVTTQHPSWFTETVFNISFLAPILMTPSHFLSGRSLGCGAPRMVPTPFSLAQRQGFRLAPARITTGADQGLSRFADIPVLLVGGRQYTSGICWASSIFKSERILVSIWIYRAVLADDSTWPILSA